MLLDYMKISGIFTQFISRVWRMGLLEIAYKSYPESGSVPGILGVLSQTKLINVLENMWTLIAVEGTTWEKKSDFAGHWGNLAC